MDLKTYISKNILLTFFIISTCISVAMAVLGLIFEPETRMGYEGLLYPVVFGALTTLPQFILYSKKELSARQMLVRKVLRLLVTEVEILLVVYVAGGYTDPAIAVSLLLTVLVIAATVELVMYVNDSSKARQFNAALRNLQRESKTQI